MGKSPAPEMMEINRARRDMPTQGRVMGSAAGQLTLHCELWFAAGISYSATQWRCLCGGRVGEQWL